MFPGARWPGQRKETKRDSEGWKCPLESLLACAATVIPRRTPGPGARRGGRAGARAGRGARGPAEARGRRVARAAGSRIVARAGTSRQAGAELPGRPLPGRARGAAPGGVSCPSRELTRRLRDPARLCRPSLETGQQISTSWQPRRGAGPDRRRRKKNQRRPRSKSLASEASLRVQLSRLRLRRRRRPGPKAAYGPAQQAVKDPKCFCEPHPLPPTHPFNPLRSTRSPARFPASLGMSAPSEAGQQRQQRPFVIASQTGLRPHLHGMRQAVCDTLSRIRGAHQNPRHNTATCIDKE